MLKFTNSQIAEISIRMFGERVQTHLRSCFPQVLAEQHDLNVNVESLVVLWITEALGFGVVNEPDVEFYVQCKVLFGRDFASSEDTRWAAAILQRRDLDGESKMDLIDEYMLFGLKEPA